jgi:hypothetical protein
MDPFRFLSRQWLPEWWGPDSVLSVSSPAHPLALDTETEVVTDPLRIPRLALVTVSDGERAFVLHPDQVGAFLDRNRAAHFVAHNLAFDFWVIDQHLKGHPARRVLWDQCERGQLHDSMILDMLLQLATGEYRYDSKDKVYPSNLGDLADEWLGEHLNKEDPYRMRYGELLGLTPAVIEQGDPGFIAYALKDVIATALVYRQQYAKAVALMKRVGWSPTATGGYTIRPDALLKFGPLSERVQVQGSIALAHLSRRPLTVDQEARGRLELEYRTALDAAVIDLEQAAPGLWKRFKEKKRRGQLRLTKKGKFPQQSQAVLLGKLLAVAEELRVRPPISKGKTGRVSLGAKDWSQWKDRHPFLSSWVKLEHVAKRLELLAGLNAPQVYTRYDLLKLTGRTSAGQWKEKGKPLLPGLNLQQVPRESAFRALFVAEPGKTLLPADYAYLELRTLAATCQARFGSSKLGDTIREHTTGGKIDPHQRTGAALLGVTPDAFLSLPAAQQKAARQSAKAINFGFPGGLGVKRFVDYAAGSYGVKVTEWEAKRHRRAWIDAYPEMGQYLSDSTLEAIALNLQLSLRIVREIVGEKNRWDLSKFLRGVFEGNPDREQQMEDIAHALYRAADKKAPANLLAEGDKLLEETSCTLSGRLRAGCGYTDARNTPFQGLAADGGKRATWRLLYLGYDVLAFIHDEIIVSLPAAHCKALGERVMRVMNEAMEEVMGHGVPSMCEGHCTNHWSK